jgi:hypothetical protein
MTDPHPSSRRDGVAAESLAPSCPRPIPTSLPINHHCLTADELGVIAGKEQRYSCNVFGTPRARLRLKGRKELRGLFAARNAIVR